MGRTNNPDFSDASSMIAASGFEERRKFSHILNFQLLPKRFVAKITVL
jgi:hypothetical protein